MIDVLESDGGWEKLTYTSQDGLALAGRKYGWANRAAPTVVCLAGLTRNSADFHELAMHLSRNARNPCRVLCLDYRGRGMSQHDRDWRNYEVITETGDVIAGLVAAGVAEAVFVGTSRGGLIIFALTAIRPTLLKGAVLNDVGPKIEAQGLVRIKNYLENARDFQTMEDAARALREIGHGQFPGWDMQMWTAQAERIYEPRGGKLRQRYDKKVLTALAALNLDNQLPTMWPQFEALGPIPVLAIRGENSDLLAAGTLEQMQRRHPRLTAHVVEGQGHAPDLGTAGLPRRIENFMNEM